MIETTSAIAKNNIEQVLSRIRQISNQNNKLHENQTIATEQTQGFGSLLQSVKNGLTEVSRVDTAAETIKNAYIKGDTDIPLSEVLVASAKSKVAFEGLIAIRKHFIEAYKEVMNMPV